MTQNLTHMALFINIDVKNFELLNLIEFSQLKQFIIHYDEFAKNTYVPEYISIMKYLVKNLNFHCKIKMENDKLNHNRRLAGIVLNNSHIARCNVEFLPVTMPYDNSMRNRNTGIFLLYSPRNSKLGSQYKFSVSDIPLIFR